MGSHTLALVILVLMSEMTDALRPRSKQKETNASCESKKAFGGWHQVPASIEDIIVQKMKSAVRRAEILPDRQSTQVVVLGSWLNDGDVQNGGKCPTPSDAAPVVVWLHPATLQQECGWRECKISNSRFAELRDGTSQQHEAVTPQSQRTLLSDKFRDHPPKSEDPSARALRQDTCVMWQCSICQPTLSADGWFPTDSGKHTRWTSPDYQGGYTACGEAGRQCAGVHMKQCLAAANAEMAAGLEDMQLDVQGEPVLVTGKPMSQDLTRPSSVWSAYLPQLPDGASVIGADGVPGLSYNNASHTLSGIPTEPGQHNLTYYLKLSPRGMDEQTRAIVVDDGSTILPNFELPGEVLFDSGRRTVTAQTIYSRLPKTLGPYDCNGGGVVQIPGRWLYNIQAVIIGNGDNMIQLRPGEFAVDDRIYQSNVVGADGVSECANMLTFVPPPRDPPTAAQGALGWSEGIFFSQTGQAGVLPTGWSLFYKDLSEATAEAAVAALAGVDSLFSEFRELTLRNRAHARNQTKTEAKEEASLQDNVDQLFERMSLDQSVVTFDVDLLDGLHNALQLAEEVAHKRPYFADDWALSAQTVINAIDSKGVHCDKTRLKQLKGEAQEIVRKIKEILHSSHFALVAADKVRTVANALVQGNSWELSLK